MLGLVETTSLLLQAMEEVEEAGLRVKESGRLLALASTFFSLMVAALSCGAAYWQTVTEMDLPLDTRGPPLLGLGAVLVVLQRDLGLFVYRFSQIKI